jgi:hypothetical protein
MPAKPEPNNRDGFSLADVCERITPVREGSAMRVEVAKARAICSKVGYICCSTSLALVSSSHRASTEGSTWWPSLFAMRTRFLFHCEWWWRSHDAHPLGGCSRHSLTRLKSDVT